MKPHIATLSVLVVVDSTIAAAVFVGGELGTPTAVAGEKPEPKAAIRQRVIRAYSTAFSGRDIEGAAG